MREEHLGLESFLTETPPLGGRLRSRIDDFVVSEVPRLRGSTDGIYLVFRIRAWGWETNALVREISKRLGISRSRISFAGTKDRRAVTDQYISIKGLQYADLRIPRVEILETQRRSMPVRMGDLLGNRFLIVVRDVIKENTPYIRQTAELLLNAGVPNFFGVQRFGALRGNTHLVGKCILLGDLEGAIDLYVGRPAEGEPEEIRRARKAYDEGMDFREVSQLFPPGYFERALLQTLAVTGDCKRALSTLPRNLQLMFVHAYQSYLFNRILSVRLRERMILPEEGDIVLPAGRHGLPAVRREIRVRAHNLSKVKDLVIRGRAYVTAPLLGHQVAFADGEPGEIERKIVEEEGIMPERFRIGVLPHLSTRGIRRPIMIPLQDFRYDIMDDAVTFSFFLMKGGYATSVLREFMKSRETMDY